MRLQSLSIMMMFAVSLFSHPSLAGNEGMPSMPLIQPKRTFVVSAKDDLQAEQGFGDKEPMVKMMNMMMVEGSGLQGMDMNMEMGQTVAQNETPKSTETMQMESAPIGAYDLQLKTSPKAKVGVNAVQFLVIDPKTNKPAKGLKLKAQVFMTSMDMGTEEPVVKEKSSGLYEVRAGFSMKGPWAVKVIFPDMSEKVLNFDAGGTK